MGRFINADAFASTGQGVLGNNMFAYCLNNPVNGCDSSGNAYQGIYSQINYNEHDHTYGGLRENFYAFPDNVIDGIVVDFSWAFPNELLPCFYTKVGGSLVFDFENTALYFYLHVGGGVGLSAGPSFSVGDVFNYDNPTDYSKWFVDINAAYYLGVDHCWDPMVEHENATQSTSVTIGNGGSIGVGVDWFFQPIQIFDWEE